MQTSYAVVDALTAVAARHELSLTLLRVAAILRDRTPTMSELAQHLGLDRSSVTGLVDRAVARGLLRRSGDERDRRSSRVALTDAGHELARTCADEVDRELAPSITRLTAAQRGQLTRLLTALGTVDRPAGGIGGIGGIDRG